MTIDHEPSYLDPDPIGSIAPVGGRFRFADEADAATAMEPSAFEWLVAKITETHERPHATALDRIMGPWIGVLAWLTLLVGSVSVFFEARPSSLIVPGIALGLGVMVAWWSVFAGRCRGVNSTRVALFGVVIAGLVGFERYLHMVAGH